MQAANLRELEIGDDVDWWNPLDPTYQGSWHIVDILTESGYVENAQSPLLLINSEGEHAEVLAQELH